VVPTETIIMHGSLMMELRLLPSSSLLLHERTIPSMVDALIRKLRRDGAVRDPVMADSASRVVLDGMHRVTALTQMGCLRIPTCLLPYSDPSVVVRCWYRTITGRRLSELMEKLPRRSAWRSGEALEGYGLTIRSRLGSLSLTCGSVEEAYSLLEQVEEAARRWGLKVGYEKEEYAREKLRSGKVSAVIATPAISKEDVVSLAIQGRIFPPKSTRHIFPARPVELNLPLRILTKPSDTDAQAEFEEILASRVPRPMPAGSGRGTRNYQEELYVLSSG